MTLYRDVLKKALDISWRYKYLWFFGVFATLLGGSGSEVMFRFSGNNGFIETYKRFCETGIFSHHTFSNIGHLLKTDTATMVILLFFGLVTLVLIGFLIWLSVVSQVALVDNSAVIISSKKKKIDVGIRQGVLVGAKKFWPVFGLNILVKVIIFLALLIASIPIVVAGVNSNSLFLSFIYLLLFIILLLFGIAIAFAMKYAIAYIVIKNNKIINSIQNGWSLFVKNWLVSLEMAVILFLVNILAGIAIALVVLTAAIPLFFLSMLFLKVFGVLGFWLILILGFILIMVFSICAGAFLTTFQISAWTGLFVQLVGKGGESKIIRLVDGWKK